MGPRAHLDADALERGLRRAGERFGKCGEDARRALDEDDARSGGIDQAEVAGDGLARDLAERAGQLDARRAAADHHEGEERLLLGAVALALGGLVRQQHPTPDLERVLEGLEPRRQQLPVVVAEVRVAGARRQDERVVVDFVAIEDEPARGQIHTLHVRQEDRDVGRTAHDGAKRDRDVRRIERGGGHLIQQRLEQMMVAPVQQRDPHGAIGQRSSGIQPAEAPADDHDVRAGIGPRHTSMVRRRSGRVHARGEGLTDK